MGNLLIKYIMKHFTLSKQAGPLTIAIVLLITGSGCKHQPSRPAQPVEFIGNAVENKHLNDIVFGRNGDSIAERADADYQRNECYYFWSLVVFEGKFDSYLAAYAKQKYGLTMVNAGYRAYAGACCYNSEVDKCLLKANGKSFTQIYLQAKIVYNEWLRASYAYQ
jgi:hypothetical protein